MDTSTLTQTITLKWPYLDDLVGSKSKWLPNAMRIIGREVDIIMGEQKEIVSKTVDSNNLRSSVSLTYSTSLVARVEFRPVRESAGIMTFAWSGDFCFLGGSATRLNLCSTS